MTVYYRITKTAITWAKFSLSIGLGGVVLHLFAWCGALLTPALASDHFNLENKIPITIEDIEPIERGSLEFQSYGRFLAMRDGRRTGEAEPRFALGIFDKTQLEIGAPFLLGQGTANGNGDVEISVLRKFWDAPRDRWSPGFAMEADFRLPIGIQQPGFTNGADLGMTALLKKDLGKHVFHINAGFDWTADESTVETLRRGVWSAAIGHHVPLTDRMVLVSDLAWSQAEERHTKDVWLLETGIRAQLTPKVIGAIGIGAGLNRGSETPVFSMTFGLQVGLGRLFGRG